MKKLAIITLALLALTGCASSLEKQNAKDTTEARARLQTIILEQKTDKPSNFSEQDEPTLAIKLLGRSQQEAKEKEWLTDIRITLDPAKNAAIPAPAIIRMFRDKGINLVTALPLDLYTYNGFGVTDVNAETALMVFMGAMGLDFDIDNSNHLITIEPMRPKTWTFNIGNRRTSFTAGTTAETGASTTSPQMPTGMPGMMPQASTATPTTVGGTNSIGISSSDDVWSKLSTELSQRLTILVPKTNTGGIEPIVPAISQQSVYGQPAKSSTPGNNMYDTQTVGRFSINPETGAITVQAPKYILKNLGEYLTKVQDMYNTSITFEGEVVTVTTTNNKSEGIDWTAFNAFGGGGRYTSVIQNNILGGAVISPAAGTNAAVDALTIANASLPGAGALFGVMSATKKFAAFNAFLSSVGELKIKDTPLVTTTSGTPVKFENYITRHYQRFEQTAAAGGVGSATVATNTIYVPYKIGMTLRLNPRYDIENGLVRTQFSIERSMINGFEQQVNPISTGNTVQLINTQTPILGDTANDGELLLKNGDLVVVGGLTEDSEDNNDSGITGTLDTPLKSLTGKGVRNKSTTTYYFALRVTVTKKN